METNTILKRIRIDFNVTEKIQRFVYLYVIVSKDIHLIDTGVAGTETIVEEYLKSIGRDISEVKSILLTHSHPDHIGSASRIKELSGCTVYACEAEKSWIENIDEQFAERPIPNFYTLLNKSVSVDKVLKDNDILTLEEGVTIKVIDTRGHSAGSLSFLWIEQGELFTGDSIPAIGEKTPIYVSAKDSIETLRKLLALDGVKRYLPAWDDIYDKYNGKAAIIKSLDYLLLIDDTVKSVLADFRDKDIDEVYTQVIAALNIQNPLFLFKTSVLANIKEAREKISTYFIVNTRISDVSRRKQYDEYIVKVKPIVESYGGKYIVRSEKITALWDSPKPDRINIIQFPSKEQIFKWLSSPEYKEIVNLRQESVETEAIIVEDIISQH